MSKHTNRATQVPWDRRPVTARDMAVMLGLLLIACVASAVLIAVALQNQTEAAIAGGTQVDVASSTGQPLDEETADAMALTGSEPVVVEYTLRTVVGGDPAMAFVGVGGEIDGVANPNLTANLGDTVRITVINGDPMLHDLTIEELGVTTGDLTQDEETVTVEFVVDQTGAFSYYCSVPGHRNAGMEGLLQVEGTVATGEEGAIAESEQRENGASSGVVAVSNEAAPAVADAASIIRSPIDLPPPITASDRVIPKS